MCNGIENFSEGIKLVVPTVIPKFNAFVVVCIVTKNAVVLSLKCLK